MIKVEFFWKNTSAWVTLQAAGAANGTILTSNNTYRVAGNTRLAAGAHDTNWATAWRINYQTRDPIESSGYLGLKNSTGISNSVFNIVGIVLTVSAIMVIIGVIYMYVRPGGGGSIGLPRLPGM
jgi:hypothetical protein